jgi:hypothetical protein
MKSFKVFNIRINMELVMLVPHHGAPFEETMVFTSLDKAKKFWLFIENRECVEFKEFVYDKINDVWFF